MKKAIVILFIFLGSGLYGELLAQRKTYLGVKGGYNMSTAYFFHSFFGADVSTGFENGLQGGIVVMNYLRNHVGLQAELLYTQKGWKQKFGGSQADLITDLDYIELPLLLNIHTGKEQMHFFANAGCFVEFLSAVSQSEVPADDNLYAFKESRDNKFGYGFRGGVGAFYDFNFGTLLFESSLSYSLSDMMDPISLDTGIPNTSKNIVIGFSVAYMFAFGEL